MTRLAVLCAMVIALLQLVIQGDAVCCKAQNYHIGAKRAKLCHDCKPGTPYCSVTGTCNVFGCNCDGGCRQGQCDGRILGKRAASTRIENAHDVIRAADVDGDGRMSLEEARLHLGLSSDRVRRSLLELDTDYDDFLSAEEIDTDDDFLSAQELDSNNEEDNFLSAPEIDFNHY